MENFINSEDGPRVEAYTRHEPWSLAPWLTGMIVAVVIFVVLIPAICSACFHYYYYKHGFDDEELDCSDDDEDDDDLNDDKDDDNDDGDDVFSIDVEEELRKKGKKSCGHKKGRMLCPCLWKRRKNEGTKSSVVHVSDVSLTSVDKPGPKKSSGNNLDRSSASCPLHCKPDPVHCPSEPESLSKNIFLEKKRKVCCSNDNFINSKHEKDNGSFEVCPPSPFDEIISIIEEGRKRRILASNLNGGQKTFPPMSSNLHAKRVNSYRMKSLSMDTFQSEQQQKLNPHTDPLRNQQPMMKKSQTHTWSTENRRSTPTLANHVAVDNVTMCGHCSIPRGSSEIPTHDDSTPSPRSVTSIWPPNVNSNNFNRPANHNKDEDDYNNKHFSRPCFKHQSYSNPTPPPPPPVSPDVTLLSFSPSSCSQRCQTVLQKKSHQTIWHPRSGATTVSYAKD